VFADFDGEKMHLPNQNPEARSVVTLSISWKSVPLLLKNGGLDDMKTVYGSMVQAPPENGYDFTIVFDADNLPGNKEKFPETAGLFKRHLLAAPFKRAFAAAEKGQNFPMLAIDYRDDEAFYIKAEPERVTVVFSIMFRDADDQVFAKIFLQEFVDAKKKTKSLTIRQLSLTRRRKLLEKSRESQESKRAKAMASSPLCCSASTSRMETRQSTPSKPFGIIFTIISNAPKPTSITE